MADWANPTVGSNYLTFVDEVKDRDVDVGLMQAPSANTPTNYKRYNTSDNKFQSWNGAAWVDLILSIAGGGTGAATASAARTNLGLGSMALQDANAVAIVGGTISGISSLSVSGNTTITGTADIQNLASVDGLVSEGTDGIPASVTTNAYYAGGFSSPATGRIYFGDGTGKKFFLTRRAASVDTDVIEIRDTGRFTLRGNDPIIEVRDLNASADMGIGGFFNTGNDLHFFTLNDAESSSDNYLRIIRAASSHLVDRAEFHTTLRPMELLGVGGRTSVTINSSGGALNNQVINPGANTIVDVTVVASAFTAEIGGITAGFDGQLCILRFVSITGANGLVTKEDAGVTAADRLIGPFTGGVLTSIGGTNSAIFVYSTTSSRWFYIGGNLG